MPERFSAEVFLVNRIEKSIRKVSKQVRLFKKGSVKPTGIIHWGYIINGESQKLDNEYYLFHQDPYTEKIF